MIIAIYILCINCTDIVLTAWQLKDDPKIWCEETKRRINDVGEIMLFQCPANAFIAGVSSRFEESDPQFDRV